MLHDELAGNGVSVCAVCPGAVRTDQLAEEHAWGPTGGASYQNAMASDAVARRIVLASGGSAPVVVVDKPHCEWPSTLWASWADRGGCALPSSGRRSKRCASVSHAPRCLRTGRTCWPRPGRSLAWTARRWGVQKAPWRGPRRRSVLTAAWPGTWRRGVGMASRACAAAGR
ncbi:MAG: hypothetical protein ACLP22_17515 [Solirubrobacteraceae bacterium]